MRYVFLLLQNNAIRFDGDVYVQQIRDGSFVFDVPSRGQVRRETIVQGTRAIVGVQSKKIIDIAP
eukprot:2237141-Pleurochrysis_carterae.AAC.1